MGSSVSQPSGDKFWGDIVESRDMNTEESVKVRLDSVSKAYGTKGGDQRSVLAIQDMTLSVRHAEIVSIVGPTGCGKSTLIDLIAGFERPTSGELLLDDKSIVGPGPDRAVVFQNPALFPWLTVESNISLGVKSRGMPKEEYVSKREVLMEAVGLGGFGKHYPYQLSGGMRQRVQIARALIGNPEVLLMDEPFGALDYQTRIQMQKLLLDLWSQFQPTIFFITHDVGEAIFISDRVLMMTRRPARVKSITEVLEQKPRDLDFLTSDSFFEYERSLQKSVQEEIGAAME